jgi:Outer membrane protein beta-barrel domain
MKILASLLALSGFLVATDVAHAQSRSVGVKGGLTLASADIEDISGTFNAENRTGWGIGAFLSLGSGVLSVQPELNFVENGFDSLTPLGNAEVKLRYLLPAVLLRVGLPTPVVRPRIFGGVGVGIEAGCKINDADCEDSPFGLETKSTDPTGIFGADLDISIGPSTALRGDVRYAIGFSDIKKASDVWTEIKNRAWAVSAGLSFRF